MLLVLTILYILLDVIFGFTIKEYLKNTILVNDSQEYAEYHLIFEEVKSKFNIGEVKFLLNNNEEINAFAIATFRKNYIIVSKGMDFVFAHMMILIAAALLTYLLTGLLLYIAYILLNHFARKQGDKDQ